MGQSTAGIFQAQTSTPTTRMVMHRYYMALLTAFGLPVTPVACSAVHDPITGGQHVINIQVYFATFYVLHSAAELR